MVNLKFVGHKDVLYKIFIETTYPMFSLPRRTCIIVALFLVNNISQTQIKCPDNAMGRIVHAAQCFTLLC